MDNFFFGDSGGDASFVVFDWQLLTRTQGPFDLSYFMIRNLEPELRREIEKDLLQKYCAELKKHGVEGYSLEQCYHSYRITLYDLILFRLVAVGATLDVSSDRGQALMSTNFARTSEAIIDYPIIDLI